MAEYDFDLVIVGAGSGNMMPAEVYQGWRVAIAESGRFGGTCLNRGCIPSKMLVYTADVARAVQEAGKFGIHAEFNGADWPAIRDRVFGRIDPQHDRAVEHRRGGGVAVFSGEARFAGPYALRVGDDVLRSERFVLATGSRPAIPEIPGLAQVPYVTSDDVMRLDALPGSMVVFGGGYIAAEISHIFGSLGTKVTIVTRGERLLSRHDAAISERFTDVYQSRFDVRLGARVDQVAATGNGIRAELTTPAGRQAAEGEVLLVATGRVPNSDVLDVAAAGLAVDEHGHVKTDDTYATSVPGIWAFGDLANHFQLKHMANAEARLVGYNVLHPGEPRRASFPVVPAAVFADPQVASAGATEQALQARGRRYVAATRDYSRTAYGWALQDTTGFVKVLADPDNRLLLGAHIIGPQASTLIQPLVQAMCLGNTADEVASHVLYIHPALSEVVEQALLRLRGHGVTGSPAASALGPK
ncbi:MAG TPA: mycothione reductase [Streptosporangiaceae bacterium]|nr:mycothione reductase [Streptosporangiaceae bacterium]